MASSETRYGSKIFLGKSKDEKILMLLEKAEEEIQLLTRNKETTNKVTKENIRLDFNKPGYKRDQIVQYLENLPRKSSEEIEEISECLGKIWNKRFNWGGIMRADINFPMQRSLYATVLLDAGEEIVFNKRFYLFIKI